MKLCEEDISVACNLLKFGFLSIRKTKDVSKKLREGFSNLLTPRH